MAPRRLCLAASLAGLSASVAVAQSGQSPAPITPSPVPATAEPQPAATPASPESTGDVMPAEAPTSTSQELDRLTVGKPDPESFWQKPLVYLAKGSKSLEEESGLRVGMALTMLLQQATGDGGERTAAAGDVDLMMRWTAVGRGTKNTGVLVFNTEYRFQMGDITPSALNTQVDAATPTTNGFGERPVVVKELYWVQDLAEGAVRIGVGRADPENLTTAHKMQSANTFFQHKAFSGNPSVAFPGSGPTLAAAYRTDQWFVGGGIVNAYSTTTTMQIDSLSEWDLFSFVEAGWTPKVEGLGAGRYRVAYWHIDPRNHEGVVKPEDSGINFIVDQELGEKLNFFFRYGYSQADVTGMQNLVEGGLGYKGLSEEGLTGLAVAYLDYSSPTQQNETVAELFHRWQLTPQAQFTLGAEMIVDPANSPTDNTVGVFNVRLRLTF